MIKSLNQVKVTYVPEEMFSGFLAFAGSVIRILWEAASYVYTYNRFMQIMYVRTYIYIFKFFNKSKERTSEEIIQYLHSLVGS